MNDDAVIDRLRVSELYRRTMSSGRARLADVLGGHLEVESSGAWITTSEGEKFLNAGGYGVFITGARHPAVVREVDRQLHTHPIGTRMFLDPAAARAGELLTSVTPPGLDKVHFSCSGAEAVEAAIKLARLNGRRHLVSMFGGYHGKTMGALSLTAKNVFQDPFRPLLPDVSHVPYGDVVALTAVLELHPGEACVIVEPVQGEAGVIIPPPGYLSAVRAVCSEYGALLVVDEVQTGLGRLGAWWGVEAEGVRPDILLSGKALGGGVIPVAATIATQEVFSVLDRDPILHTSTFSAAPIAMAAVCGAIRAIRDDGLVDRAAELGARLVPEFERIKAVHLPHHQCEVRGVGLLIGVEFADPSIAADLFLALVGNNVVANLSLNSDHVVRFTPPAVMTESDVEFLVDRFERAVKLVAERNPEYEVLANA
ncbi:aminotransferase class III-fold pyridoxal phosphate-dependent enzyme [Umezawaea sp. Da 62-37]|uniref:aspartate aminotransferase family protein n=1 Tax=Umezawaea sp. Da 62-37 TaxID=3075927 RepID=UPI0028F71C94|nr:aminotransferase class III-fold pyridoxal phosphate-dependent enzyme [Umezawaea sp. Da 62-37]WNV85252.1 aminotransferase class III-fold pyridoxal phosphate-dependent enzyme [Umezawaea sp. Da 62-37]